MSSLCTLMLTFIDENTKFGQTESTPMLLLDGHGSSFESVFLKKRILSASNITIKSPVRLITLPQTSCTRFSNHEELLLAC